MKERLLGLLLMPILIGGMSIVNASDTSCWSTYGGTVPTTTYASGIVYGCDGDTPIITIYGDDGKGITIKAMNEGATTIGAKNVNTGSYGYHFQWGNNHGFESCYSDECKTFPGGEGTGSIQVDVSNYGPVGKSISGYYDSGTWIKQSQWSTDNRNLWGGSGDYGTNHNGIYNGAFWGFNTGDFTVTNSGDRKGMCPQGYHIPSEGEWSALLYLWGKNYDTNQGTLLFTGWSLNSLNYNYNSIDYSLSGTGNRFSEDMQIPFVGYRDNFETVYANSIYWSSSPNDNDYISHCFSLGTSYLVASSMNYRGQGFAVRCFKNSYVKLPKTLNLFFMSDGEEVGTGEVTENMTGAVPEKAKNLSRTGYEFFWIRSGATTTGIFDFDTTPISGAWADENNKVYFIAQWTGIKYSVEFTGTDVEGTMENQTFTYDVTGTLTPNAFTRDGYTFSGWTDGTTGYTDGQEVINLTTTSGDVITLTAEWTKIETKPSGGSSGGGGRSSSKDVISNDSEKSSEQSVGSQVDSQPAGQVSEQAPQNDNSNTQDSSANASEGQTYTQEFQQAYEFAHEKGITTMPTIQKADMDGKLTRIAMAKMLSQYAMNVLGQKPANIVTPKFNDVTDKQNSDYDDGVSLAYQLGIMGQNMPNNKFRPDDEVTRAEFATALSRMLYHTSDGEYKSTDKYYTNHMKKLVQEKIITNDDAKMKELRGYVMIMLMRSAK